LCKIHKRANEQVHVNVSPKMYIQKYFEDTTLHLLSSEYVLKVSCTTLNSTRRSVSSWYASFLEKLEDRTVESGGWVPREAQPPNPQAIGAYSGSERGSRLFRPPQGFPTLLVLRIASPDTYDTCVVHYFLCRCCTDMSVTQVGAKNPSLCHLLLA